MIIILDPFVLLLLIAPLSSASSPLDQVGNFTQSPMWGTKMFLIVPNKEDDNSTFFNDDSRFENLMQNASAFAKSSIVAVNRNVSTLNKTFSSNKTSTSPHKQRFTIDPKSDGSKSSPSCQQGNWASFVRIPRAMIMGVPTVVTTMDVTLCAEQCRNNSERPCQGFNYQDTSTPTCEFFDGHSPIGPLNHNVGQRSFYFDKVCLNDAFETCRQRSYAFESIPNAQLKNNILKQFTVVDNLACLSACLHESAFICQSVNYVKDKNLCELSSFNRRTRTHDFQLEVIGVDYYENNCLTKNTRCSSGDVYFVKTFNTDVPAATDITESLASLNSCLQKCLESDFIFCRSVEFDRSANECLISDEDSHSAPDILPLANSLGVDLFEPICLSRNNVAHAQCKRPYLFEKFLNAALNVVHAYKTLNNLVLEDCLVVCTSDTRCRSVNYNKKTRICQLSDQDKTNTSIGLVEAVEVDYYENNCNKERFQALSISCSFRLEASNRALRILYRNDQLRADSVASCHLMCQTVTSYECRSFSYSNASHFCHLSDSEPDTLPVKLLTQVEPGFEYFVRDRCTHPRPLLQQQQQTAIVPKGASANDAATSTSPEDKKNKKSSESSGSKERTTATFSDSDSATTTSSGSDSAVVNPSPRHGSAPTLSPQSVQVSAICNNDGVNVTVRSSQLYTGAVYAAERFSFCRNLVTSQNSFWLFLPRPNVNSACNTILVNDQMSGVVVISNDNIIPYDVTTKDDLFYQITCDFSSASSGGGKVVVTSGVVIGGPTPRVIAAAGVSSTSYEASLRILRAGAPVKNVLIGEQLTLSIESNSEPSKMQALNCNVSRVGGSGPLPEPLTVVDNGCPMVPQVIGSIQHGSKGLETSLTAFRIDGSAEIQIVCLLLFCEKDCPPAQCSNSDGSGFQSFGRRRRKANHLHNEFENEHLVESVNGRLRVFVEGEDGAPSKDDLLRDGVSASSLGCIPETTFVAVTVSLGILLIMLLASFACLMCRRSWMTSIQQKCISENLHRFETRYNDASLNPCPAARMSKRMRADLLGTSQM